MSGLGCTPTYTRAPTSLSILPLHTLRLYETGIGYFERAGSVSGDDTGLPLPAGHLDDALKTLVIYSQDKTLASMACPSRPASAKAWGARWLACRRTTMMRSAIASFSCRSKARRCPCASASFR